MPRRDDTSKHPARRVDWDSVVQRLLISPLRAQNDTSAQDWMDDPSKAPYINRTPATFSPETLKEFGLDNDNAPAGGIKRPEMESCTNCGTETPKGSGSCADCK